MSAHDEGKAEAAQAVLEKWLRLAKAARDAGMTDLADQAEKFAALKRAQAEGEAPK